MSIHADEVLTREVESRLPAFWKMCQSAEVDLALLCQSAFGTSEPELLLFGQAVKYAGLKGKEVRVLV